MNKYFVFISVGLGVNDIFLFKSIDNVMTNKLILLKCFSTQSCAVGT